MPAIYSTRNLKKYRNEKTVFVKVTFQNVNVKRLSFYYLSHCTKNVVCSFDLPVRMSLAAECNREITLDKCSYGRIRNLQSSSSAIVGQMCRESVSVKSGLVLVY